MPTLPCVTYRRHTSVFNGPARFPIAIVLFALICPLSGPDGAAQTASGANTGQRCSLRIHVDGLRNSNGVIGSTVFRSADGWPEDNQKSFRRGPTDIAPGQRGGIVVWELPPGDYAVAAIHDENRNARLDRNFIGIPKEGFGFANNPHVGLSAPSWKAALVHVECPATEITIHMQYK